MKKAIIAFLTVCLVAGSTMFAYAEDIDAQIEALESQIRELQSQLDTLKAQKAQSDVGDENSEDSYVETDRIFNVYDSYGDTRYDAIIEITNTSNDLLYLSDGVFDLEDAEGHLIQTDDMISTAPDVVRPGEKGYFYNQFGDDIDTGADLNTIQFVPHYKVEKANKMPHEYPVSDLSLANDEWGDVKIVGRVENDTSEDDMYVYVQAMFYNAEGKIIGITGTNVTGVSAGQKASFEISSLYAQDTLDSAAIADYKVVAQEMYMQF